MTEEQRKMFVLAPLTVILTLPPVFLLFSISIKPRLCPIVLWSVVVLAELIFFFTFKYLMNEGKKKTRKKKR